MCVSFTFDWHVTCACYCTCCNVVSICLLLEFQNFTRQFDRLCIIKLIQTHTALTYIYKTKYFDLQN